MRRFSWLLLLVAPFACVEEADPPAYGVYQVYGLLAEVNGGIPVDPATSTVTVPRTMLLTRSAFTGPLSQPDFATSPAPPTCLGLRFSADKPPGGDGIDGGDLVFSGLRPSSPIAWVDLSDRADPTPTPLLSPIQCTQIDDPFASEGESGIRHNCVPSTFAVYGGATVFGDDTSVTISATGGSQSGAFTAPPLSAPDALNPEAPFDLARVDPRGPVTARWTPVDAPFALIEIVASALGPEGQLVEGAQILCLEEMDAGQKVIPAGALALVPELAVGQPMQVITSLAAVNPAVSDEGWGDYVVGVGRGAFGVTFIVQTP